MTDRTRGYRPDYAKLNKGEKVLIKPNDSSDNKPSKSTSEQVLNESTSEPDFNNNNQHSTPNTQHSTLIKQTETDTDSTLENRLQLPSSLSNSKFTSTHNMSSDEDAKDTKDPKLSASVSSASKSITKLLSQAEALEDDITDFIDENPSEPMTSPEEIDSAIKRVEDYRSAYRTKHRELQRIDSNYESTSQQQFQMTLGLVKKFIKDAQAKRSTLRKGESKIKDQAALIKTEKLSFLSVEVDRVSKELKTAFDEDISDETDEEITKRKKEFPDQSKKVDILSKHIQQIIELGETAAKVKSIKDDYEEINESRDTYRSKLDAEDKLREIEKQKSFNKSSLNIKLGTFSGYNSDIDIYTFQDQFEKIKLKETPKNLLPDMLKNNYLEEPALTLVKNVTDVDEIWKRLKDSYGDCKILLSKKLSSFSTIGETWKHNDPAKVVDSLGKIINLMKDLQQLVKRHNIENNLYFGGAIENVYHLLGYARLNRWLLNRDADLDGEDEWEELLEFLEKELKVAQQHANIISSQPKSLKDKETKDKVNKKVYRTGDSNGQVIHNDGVCSFCGESGHVQTSGPGGMKLVQYFACKKFVESSCAQRLNIIFSKGFCIQCLFPGASVAQGKHKEGRCQRDFICQHPNHSKFPVKKHVLLCADHKDTPENKDILEKYKARCILRQRNLPDFSKDIHLSHYCSSSLISLPMSPQHNHNDANNNSIISSSASSTAEQNCVALSSEGDQQHALQEIYQNTVDVEAALIDGFITKEENGIYILQTVVDSDGEEYNVFYDLGCGRFCSKYSAVQRLGNKARQLSKVAMPIGGVGGKISTIAYHGIYAVKIPLADGQSEAVLTGACLDQITEVFPTYPLHEIEVDIRKAYQEFGGNLTHLPNLASSVGGDTDLMIGITYGRYQPREVFRTLSGLTIYESCFKNIDGSRGVVGGPHWLVTKIDESCHVSTRVFFNQIAESYFKYGAPRLNPDVPLLGFKGDHCDNETIPQPEDQSLQEEEPQSLSYFNTYRVASGPRILKQFEEAENAGTVINYRCIDCRDCKNCKQPEHIQALSIKEEVQQGQIERSVTIDTEKGIAIASLPLLGDPTVRIAPNKEIALKSYYRQVKNVLKNPEEKQALIQSEKKLQDLNFVAWVKDLPEETQKMLKESPIQNFITWLVVWKESSTTTPVRMVFNGSLPTPSGYSLNDILPKGINMLNKMIEIFIRWRTKLHGYHCDIQKMYNAIRLKEEFWCYQRYWFQKDLDPDLTPEEKVIMTCIYGLRPSGNQAQVAIRKTAEIHKEEYPEVYDIICHDTYMDDGMSGENTEEELRRRQDEIQLVLATGGFSLKGFTTSGEDPDKALSKDGVSVAVAGMKWFSKEDSITLDIKDLNFSKKRRGRKVEVNDEIPEHLTRRDCASKLGEVFDPVGLITPLTAGMKVDLHELTVRKLNWDDTLPNELQSIWKSHLEMISELKHIRFYRAVVPEDAKDLNITTLDFGDASKVLSCVAIYVRYLLKNGTYSCQLVFSKSKLIPDNTTQPRGELLAAENNAHAGEVVRRSLSKYHTHAHKFTDSQISLFWICNNARVLKQWVRNRVIEILRFTSTNDWWYIESEDMIADLGTRGCSDISLVGPESAWVKGHDWMSKDPSEFPMKSPNDVVLSNLEAQMMKKEVYDNIEETCSESVHHIPSDKILERYLSSDYIVDPNRWKFSTVVRVVALVLRFIRKLRSATQEKKAANQGQRSHKKLNNEEIKSLVAGNVIEDKEISEAKDYFYRKSTEEIKQFVNISKYKNISTEIDGILRFSGRILPTDDISIVGRATQVMKDLSATTFAVPLIDKHSPIAYSIVNDTHWFHPTVPHRGIDITWRYILKEAYIIEGRSLVTAIKNSCERCRFLNKKNLQVAMGPISPDTLNIAPAFYATQFDLVGPFSAHCHHHTRSKSTIKIWLVVFCCSTTSTTSIKVMDNYTTLSFLDAFVRFSSEVGYPKTMQCDQGSQLVKGCESMRISFRDLQHQLNLDASVELNVCPVGGHNWNGRVERKIQEVRKSLTTVFAQKHLSVLQWETVAASIANNINNMPLSLGNSKSNLQSLDILTPNRLRLGRNNDRSPEGPFIISHRDRIIEENEKIFNSWFEIWLTVHVPRLLEQPKWFISDVDIKRGDIVLFLKNDSKLSSTYQYGIVEDFEATRDGKIRQVTVRYRNADESIDRIVSRAVRSLVVIKRVDESSIMEELGEVSRLVESSRQ